MSSREGLLGMDLERLREFDTCAVSNAIERLEVRLRNEGFISGGVRCRFPELAPMVGYAATGRIRTVSPPMTHRCYYDRMDWWNYVASLPKPRVLVLQDADAKPGLGAFVGEIHAAIGLALDCVGCVTNGAVRDLPAVKALKFQLFAGGVSVSHSYAHIIDFGEPVEIGGWKIRSGDLLHGDRHGVLNIPLEIAEEIPAEASKVLAEERELIEFCGSPKFSLEELAKRMRQNPGNCNLPWRHS
jgi:regulator of RNase E activity RraA